jgi:hypothetical protein
MAETPQGPIGLPVTEVTGTSGATNGTATPLPFTPVSGSSDSSDAVFGQTKTGTGVRGTAWSGTGVSGENNGHGIGVLGYSQGGSALLGQAGAVGVGLLAFGTYDSNPPAGSIGSPLSMGGGTLPAAVTALIKANAGFAAVLSGKATITDLLQGASATFSGSLTAQSATLAEALEAASATLSGALKAREATLAETLDAASATLTGALNAASAAFSGAVTASDVVLAGADCAEEFDLEDAQLQPGSVVVFTDNGGVVGTTEPYDRRVAGVISGAGTYRPGVILDRRPGGLSRAPIALMGKVFCKVDADLAPIRVGDLLTTSPTAGHAMRATDPNRALGAVIGKALAPHAAGRGLIPMLVTLQ